MVFCVHYRLYCFILHIAQNATYQTHVKISDSIHKYALVSSGWNQYREQNRNRENNIKKKTVTKVISRFKNGIHFYLFIWEVVNNVFYVSSTKKHHHSAYAKHSLLSLRNCSSVCLSASFLG